MSGVTISHRDAWHASMVYTHESHLFPAAEFTFVARCAGLKLDAEDKAASARLTGTVACRAGGYRAGRCSSVIFNEV